MAKSKVQPIIQSYEDLDKQLLELGRLDSFIAKKEAEMNTKLQNIKDKYAEETTEARSTKAMIEKEIQAFGLLNKGDFSKERTKSFIHGSIGFRTNPPKINQLNKKYSVATSIELLKKIFNKYTRQKSEIDKDAILTDYAAKAITDENLAAAGLRVDQEETFTIEINWEALNIVNKENAA
jgi:phage host-nuclease inhibitor protein Gam